MRCAFYWVAAGLVTAGLAGCRQPPGAVLAGPTVVVLSYELPAGAPAPVPFRSDSAQPGAPPLFMYLHPNLDTVGVPWLRRLSHLPTASWQVEFARRGRLRGRPIRYVRAERFLPLPPDSDATRPLPQWPLYHVALTYPVLPPGLGPPGSNEQLRTQCYGEHEELLYLWLPPQPAYERLPLPERRRLTDTLLLFRSRAAHLGWLRLPDGRELLSLVREERTCDNPSPAYSAILYSSWSDDGLTPGQAHYTSAESVFQPRLRWLLGQAVLTLVRDTRQQHHLPPLTPAQVKSFYERFHPYNFFSCLPHGVLFRYLPAVAEYSYGNPLHDLLPPGAAPEFELLLPYQVVAPYTLPPDSRR